MNLRVVLCLYKKLVMVFKNIKIKNTTHLGHYKTLAFNYTSVWCSLLFGMMIVVIIVQAAQQLPSQTCYIISAWTSPIPIEVASGTHRQIQMCECTAPSS